MKSRSDHSSLPIQSAIYHGRVRHRRFAPVPHRLTYSVFYLYLDLSETETVFSSSWLASHSWPAPLWLRRKDYLGGSAADWPAAVRQAAADRLGWLPNGPVRLLTHPRSFGFRMNPVSFYYLYDTSEALTAVLAEVTNTPWDERHVYALDLRTPQKQKQVFQASFPKVFHVSPFQPMEVEYRWRFTTPGRKLLVHMDNFRNNQKFFDATLTARRVPLTPQNLRASILQHPFMTWQVWLWIYWNATKLWWKKAPFYPHPKHLSRELPLRGGPSG